MDCYIVTFQAAELSTRQQIRSHLKTYEKYCPIHNYCWAIVTEKSAKEIRNSVASMIDENDRLFVMRSGTESAWRNVVGGSKASSWLKENL